MKARSGKILGAAVIAAAWSACAMPTAKAAVPIIYEVSATSSTSVTTSGTVNFDVLALVGGANGSQTDDGLVSGQFSLIQSASGVTGASLSFNLSSAYKPGATHGANTMVFGSVPGVGGNGNVGSAAGNIGSNAPTGSANDTVIGYTGISNTGPSNTVPANNGTVTLTGGATAGTYAIYRVGSGTLTVPSQSGTGGSDTITLVPRGGLGSVIKPQIAYIDGTAQSYRGDDAANVKVINSLVSVSTGPVFLKGDFNGDGGFDGSDVDYFVAALTEGDPFSQFISDNDAAFFATYGQHLTEAAVNYIGDFNADTAFDGSDVDGFIAALSGGGAGLSAVAVPEPTMGALLLVPALMMGRRRR